MTSPPRIDGVWVNERGSSLELTCDSGRLTGTYRTNVGRPDAETRFPVTGHYLDGLVGFVVAWEGFDSLTAWAGRYEAERDEIVTLWHLVSSRETGLDDEGMPCAVETSLWNAFRTQQSIFRRK